MKTINVEMTDIHDEFFTGNSYSFAMVDKDSKSEIFQCGHLDACRESLCSRIYANMKWGYDKDADLSTLRLLVFVQKPMNVGKKIFEQSQLDTITKAVIALNILEKKAGWKRTSVSRGKQVGGNDSFEKSGLIFYVEGSKNWLSAPLYVSLFALILRSGKVLDKITTKDTLESLSEKIKNIASKHHDVNDLKNAVPHLTKLLLKKKELLASYTKERLFEKSCDGVHDVLSRNMRHPLKEKLKEMT